VFVYWRTTEGRFLKVLFDIFSYLLKTAKSHEGSIIYSECKNYKCARTKTTRKWIQSFFNQNQQRNLVDRADETLQDFKMSNWPQTMWTVSDEMSSHVPTRAHTCRLWPQTPSLTWREWQHYIWFLMIFWILHPHIDN